MQRAFHEGLIQDQDFNQFMDGIGKGLRPDDWQQGVAERGGGSVQRADLNSRQPEH